MEEQKHNYNIDSNMNHDQENVDTQMLPEEVIVTGRWTNQEHMQFVECLKKYGKDWSKLEKCVPTRTGPQVRSHAQKYFNRIKKEYQTDFPLEYIHQFTKNEPKESGESWMSADNNQCSKNDPIDYPNAARSSLVDTSMCIENNKSSENRLNPPIVADKPLGYASSRMASSMGMQPPKQEKLDSSRKTFPSTMISTKYYSYQDSYKSPGEEEVKEGNGKGKKRLVKEFIKIAKQNEEADEAGTSVSIENGDIRIGNNRINIGVSCNIETVKVDNEDTLMISSDEPIAVRVVPITLNTPMIITADSASSQSISGYDKILKVLGSNYCLSDVYGQCQPFGGRKSIPCQSFHNSN